MSKRGKKTIVLVSADHDTTPSIHGALKSAGYAVLSAKTVEEAVEMLGTDRAVDLLLLDIELFHDAGGSRTIEAAAVNRDVPIVFLCSRNNADLIEPGASAAYGFVEKQSGKGVLIASVKTALGLHSTRGGLIKRMSLIGSQLDKDSPGIGDLSEKPEVRRLSDELYGALLDSTADLVFIKDSRFRYLMLNRANREFFGRSEDELLGKTDFDLMSEQAAANCLRTDQQSLRMNGLVISIEEVDGRIYESRKFPVSLDGGDRGVGAFIRDITETRRAEERLLASEKKLYLRNRIAQLFLTVPGDEIYEAILDVVREMLKSEHGCFGYIDEEERLVNVATTGRAGITCGMQRNDRSPFHEKWKGPWGRALLEGRSFYKNGNLSAPPGHVPLENALCAPVMYGDRVIGNLTLANRPGGYDERDLEDLEEMSRYISPLLFARMQYTRKEDERRIAEQKVNRHSSDMAFLSRTAMGFIELPTEADIYDYIAHCLHEIAPEFRILVNEFNPADDTTVIRAIAGEHGILAAIIKLLGRSPIGLGTPMPINHQKELMRQKVEVGPGGFHELSGGALPWPVSMAIDRLLDIGTIYGMGFARHETLYGNILLIAPRGVTLEDTSIIEAFVKQASVALQRHRAERALERSLREKELLLRELQHRVKNSLGMITSLVNLEATRSKNDDTRSTLKNIRDRINTLSKLYTLLYQSQGEDQIRLDSYLRQIIRSLLETHVGGGRSVGIDLAMEEVRIDFKRAASVGIIVNELVTNTIKHAFPDGRSGRLRIRLEPTANRLLLEVADDGIGPPGNFDITGSKGLGIELIRVLTGQLRGVLDYSRGKETVFTIKMPFP
ncbi:MAG TPA: GAF domain-containing protein [Spirochaetota bacterium]|nr:GAF domain-containing protein [Spirochaetota bacterium]